MGDAGGRDASDAVSERACAFGWYRHGSVCVYGVAVGASLLASLRFLTLTRLWLPDLSLRFLMGEVLNARPEL